MGSVKVPWGSTRLRGLSFPNIIVGVVSYVMKDKKEEPNLSCESQKLPQESLTNLMKFHGLVESFFLGIFSFSYTNVEKNS